MSRRYQPKPSIDLPRDREMLDAILAIPGSTGETYSRFYNYSPRNLGFLAMQGCPPEPVATYKKWGELGRHVTKGSSAYSILRPINVKVEDEKADEGYKLIRKFKVVRALFHYSQTAGDDLPPYEAPDWSVEKMLAELDIKQVPFQSYQGNIGGYASGREIAINPMAPNPLRTTFHETAHIENGHTDPQTMGEYGTHRGRFEVEAELTGHVVMKELDALDEETASISRGYIQAWHDGTKLEDEIARKVLTTSGRMIAAAVYPQESVDN